MPQFRLTLVDGTEENVVAKRVVTAGPDTVFERKVEHDWQTVHRIPSTEVATIHRRIIEMSGFTRWITERPQNVLSEQTHA